MSASELARFVHTWPDALTVSEVVSNPLLRVGKDWDLSDWEAVDLPDGMKFQHRDGTGHVMEIVMVYPVDEPHGPEASHADVGSHDAGVRCIVNALVPTLLTSNA